jgi:hypothetical protein
MFRGTKSLQTRTELRLRGFRGPSVRILRQELSRVMPSSRSGSLNNVISNCRREEAFHPKDTVKSTFKAFIVTENRAKWLGALQGLMAGRNWLWAHSIYSFNENTTKRLFASTEISKAAIKAYLNYMPHGSSQPLSSNDARTHFPRAFVSDLHRSQSPLPQGFSSKVSRYRAGFWRPFREMLTWEPPILFKHYSNGRIDTVLFVHDQRIEFLESRLVAIRSRIQKIIKQLSVRRRLSM